MITFYEFIISTFIPSYVIFLIIQLTFASLGWSFGFREWYVWFFLKIFEYGRQKIEKAELRNHKRLNENEIDDDICDNDNEIDKNENESLPSLKTSNHINHKREDIISCESDDSTYYDTNYDDNKRDFNLFDITKFICKGIEAIVDDEVTKCFDTAELQSWNLLTRTNKNYQFVSMRLTILWGIGFLTRYCVLMPTRIIITFIFVLLMVLCTAIIGCFPDGALKRLIYSYMIKMCFRVSSCAFSGIITFHNRENMAVGGGICVANHTSPIDVAVLACDNDYALVGQRHVGFLGILQRALARASSHVWFERFEIADRELVIKRLREHVNDSLKLPILIFPEGTCINNTSVMMFKKGTFEVSDKVYPVAIKYDPRFGDPYWNSSKHGYMSYLLLMFTSWAIVCDVWYLPPMTRKEGESSTDFANRVKAKIAKKGGLVDLMWDGQLKRMRAKPEWKEKQRQEYSKQIKVE